MLQPERPRIFCCCSCLLVLRPCLAVEPRLPRNGCSERPEGQKSKQEASCTVEQWLGQKSLHSMQHGAGHQGDGHRLPDIMVAGHASISLSWSLVQGTQTLVPHTRSGVILSLLQCLSALERAQAALPPSIRVCSSFGPCHHLSSLFSLSCSY